MRFISVLLLSSATGFLALAQEIIWVRILMYYTGGRPQVFAYVLTLQVLPLVPGGLENCAIKRLEVF